MTITNGFYYDDIYISQKFISGSHTFTKTEIIEFAKQFDPQPFHLSEEGGENSIFGGLVASGWHIGSVTMRLIIGEGSPILGGIISRGGEVKWLNPIRPGDIISVESEVIKKTPSKSKPGQGTVIIEATTLNQSNKIIQILKANLVVPKKIS
jgi:acyl dehydratase